MRKRKTTKRKLTEDQIDDRVFKAVDHIEVMLKRGYVSREQYNSFLLDLSKWQLACRVRSRD